MRSSLRRSLDRLPGARVARTYHRSWLRHDVLAGLALTAVLVPAGMGYAVAAGLPPVTGLHATIVPLVVYAVIGPSRVMILGPDSSLAPLIAATILPLAGADPERATALAATLAIIAGVLAVAAGVARFGFITQLLSLPVRYGYLNGIALLIVVSQVATMCGISTTGRGVVDGIRAIVTGLRDGTADLTSLTIGVGAFAVLVVVRRWVPFVPGALVVVLAGIGLDAVADLEGVAVVGSLPSGLPQLAWPDVAWGDVGPLLAGAAGIAVVGAADTSILSRALAARHHFEVDADHELVATGACNVATGLFQGFPVCGSASRTPAAIAAGARTQFAGVVGAAAVVVLLVWAPGLVSGLPRAVLAAVVVDAATRLADIPSVARLASVRPSELLVSVVTTISIVVVGVIPGIGVAVGLSLLMFVRRAWAPSIVELVRVDGLKGYHDVERHPEGRRIPGVVLIRFDAPLFFANADTFAQAVAAAADRPGVRWIIVTAEPMTDIDVTGAQALAGVLDGLARRGTVLAFAELKGRVRDRLQPTGLVDRIGSDRFYPTIGQAVRAAVEQTGATWTDWEDRTGT